MNDLTDLMERTTEHLQPDVAGLVSGGIERGRTLRRRRRVTTGVGATLAVAGAVAAAVVIPGQLGTSPQDASAARDEVQAATAPTFQRALPTKADLVAGRVVTLPTGSLDLISSRADDGYVLAAWRLTPSGQASSGRLDVLVERVEMPFVVGTGRMPEEDLSSLTAEEAKEFVRARAKAAKSAPYSASAACAEEPAACHELSDGSWISSFTFDEPLSGGGDSGIVSTHATLFTTDGFVIRATAYNALGEKDVQPTRDQPVLSIQQLETLVRSAHWSH